MKNNFFLINMNCYRIFIFIIIISSNDYKKIEKYIV